MDSSIPKEPLENGRGRAPKGTVMRRRTAPGLATWLRTQVTNVTRHADALRPFCRDEFGTNAAAPTEGHIQGANALLDVLRQQLVRRTTRVRRATSRALRDPSAANLQRVMRYKSWAHTRVQATERIWDFYFELFGQRQSQFADWLLSCDRIALDCYQHTYLGLGVARSIPAPPPFSYMRTGFSPATFRRGIPLRRLGAQANPFPLIQLPYHRLVNPWTLGAILHEVSHNLQNDLGLARVIPESVFRRLSESGLASVASIWTRWNREAFADMSGLLLGGPAVVGSLMDVVGRSPTETFGFRPQGPHPTPYLRVLLSTELLRRMGFPAEARSFESTWHRVYPNPSSGTMPRVLLQTAREAIPLVVDTMCYRPFPSLGNKALAQVMKFAPKEQQMVEEAARRLSSGVDPGVVPERFLIGATRFALENRLASPGTITQNFFKELARR